jgi:hypothetical protein
VRSDKNIKREVRRIFSQEQEEDSLMNENNIMLRARRTLRKNREEH